MAHSSIKKIGLAKETESPENPGALERRVALVPRDVGLLVEKGCAVFFEKGAGEGIGIADSEYEKVGAKAQTSDEIYSDKDMVIKFKGPSLENIRKMRPKSILFCMAHFASFPDRANLLKDCRINVIAMEHILESPKVMTDEIILSKRLVAETILALNVPRGTLDIGFIGYHDRLVGGIRRAGNRDPKSLTLYQTDVTPDELSFFGENAIYFYDSKTSNNDTAIFYLKEKKAQVFDLKEFEEKRGKAAIEEYRKTHPPHEFGLRRIQCLHETGVAGARYGFSLLKNESPKKKSGNKAHAVVLGYGNVGMGAIHECYDQGVRKVSILGRTNTKPGRIEKYLEKADVIVNGAEQPAELRGKNFLISSAQVKDVVPKGSVVIDLVGGSPTNRSPVEDVLGCTFLTDPYFMKHDVFVSSLWGWPMMGLMKESAYKYSAQIADVLVSREKLLAGLDHLAPGVKPALVCGPFSD